MPSLRALIFDVDGTLAETERDGHRVAFNLAFAEAGLPWHWDVTHYGELLVVTGGKERIAHHWRSIDPHAAAADDADERIHELHRRKTAHYLRLVREGGVALRPGVLRLLTEARLRGLRLAIATTTTEANVLQLLETAAPGVAGWFEIIGAGDVVPRKKPAPDIYHHVLQRLQLDADECVAFEDSRAGVEASLAAGLPTVLTRSVYSEGDCIPGVLADLDGLGLPDALARGIAPGDVSRQAWHGVVDVAMLRQWHAQAVEGGPADCRHGATKGAPCLKMSRDRDDQPAATGSHSSPACCTAPSA